MKKWFLIQKKENKLFSCIFNYNSETIDLLHDAATNLKTDLQITIPSNKDYKKINKKYSYEYISSCYVEEWIENIYNSKYIISDSYHSIIFAILFNIPFIAVGDIRRGETPMKELLETLGLSDFLFERIEDACNNFHILESKSYHWSAVNETLKKLSNRSKEWLKSKVGDKKNRRK